jgi:putative flippase GtrA
MFQYFTSLIYDGFFSLYVAMFVGTIAGLVSKYILDKKFIFHYKPESKKKEVKTFLNYTITGGFTTLIFWGVELSFDSIFLGDISRYIGAAIGLGLGYYIKYFLDKKYVFKLKKVL